MPPSRSIDVSDALGLPGVLAVVTAADLDLAPLAPSVPTIHADDGAPVLATDRVRFVGEPVAVVLTERPEQGADAAESVWVDYDPLPAVVDPEAAATDEVVLHPAAGTNVACALPADARRRPVRGLRGRRHPADPQPAGGGGARSRGGRRRRCGTEDGRLHAFVSTQNAHGVATPCAGAYGLDAAAVRVVAPDVGGGFGPKIGAHPEDLLLPWLARHVGRPVRWTETRSENLVGQVHGRAQVQIVELGGRRDGTVGAYRLTVLQDCGAYPVIGAFLPFFTRMMAAGTYAISKIECHISSVVTNTTPIGRLPGRRSTRGRRRRSSGRWTSSPPRSAWIPPRCGAATSSLRSRNRTPPPSAPSTTAATTRPPSTRPSTRPATKGCGPSRPGAGRRPTRCALGIGVASYVEITAGPSTGDEYAKVGS